jgi:hypothetical protein
MDIITAAAAMSFASVNNSERTTDDEQQGPPRKRVRSSLPLDEAPRKEDTPSPTVRAAAGGGGAPQHAMDCVGSSSIDLCPHCGNATFKKGGLRDEVDIVARGQVGGVAAAGTGRYKIRKEPRKDNRLAAWYSRFGYRGPLYCKACSGACPHLCTFAPASVPTLCKRTLLLA